MNIFPQIPGFGAFNHPLPDALGIIAGSAIDWVKQTVIQIGTSKDEPQQELETLPEILPAVDVVVAEEPQGDSNAALAINLSSPHSTLLEQSVQAQVVPDTAGDEALAKSLAEEELQVVETPKKEEKQPVSASFTSHTSKTQRRSKGHHHHHHHQRTHKK